MPTTRPELLEIIQKRTPGINSLFPTEKNASGNEFKNRFDNYDQFFNTELYSNNIKDRMKILETESEKRFYIVDPDHIKEYNVKMQECDGIGNFIRAFNETKGTLIPNNSFYTVAKIILETQKKNLSNFLLANIKLMNNFKFM